MPSRTSNGSTGTSPGTGSTMGRFRRSPPSTAGRCRCLAGAIAAGPPGARRRGRKPGPPPVSGDHPGGRAPGIVKYEKDNPSFLRQLVRLRWRFRRYFYAGRMARPPQLLGDIPTVRADWRWSNEWWVGTDAVMTGAWRLPGENRAPR